MDSVLHLQPGVSTQGWSRCTPSLAQGTVEYVALILLV